MYSLSQCASRGFGADERGFRLDPEKLGSQGNSWCEAVWGGWRCVRYRGGVTSRNDCTESIRKYLSPVLNGHTGPRWFAVGYTTSATLAGLCGPVLEGFTKALQARLTHTTSENRVYHGNFRGSTEMGAVGIIRRYSPAHGVSPLNRPLLIAAPDTPHRPRSPIRSRSYRAGLGRRRLTAQGSGHR